MVTNGIRIVELRDFQLCSVWKYDEDEDLYFPVLTSKDLPESERDISIFVECKTDSGHKFHGYIVGISRVFSMGIFCQKETFHLNKNLPDLSAEQMQKFLECAKLDNELAIDKLFPLEYMTLIKRDEFRDFSGIFDMVFT